MTLRALAVVLGCFAVSACTFSAQTASLKPQVKVVAVDVGAGQKVFVNTVDERPSDVLGNRGAQGVGAEIVSSREDVVRAVQDALVEGLRQLRFEPVPQAAKGVPELRVEIRALTYKVAMGFWAGALDVDAALKAICITGQTRPYENLHRGHYEVSVQVVQTAAENDEYINAALSDAIMQVLSDRELLSCLAGVAPP